MKTIWKMVPGLAMALVIAAAAKGLEYLEGLAGLHLIGASVIALFIGMVINRFFKPNAVTSPGIRFTSKKVLKLAIILLGASLNIMTVLKVGRFSLRPSRPSLTRRMSTLPTVCPRRSCSTWR